jgi:hypothetical protein
MSRFRPKTAQQQVPPGVVKPRGQGLYFPAQFGDLAVFKNLDRGFAFKKTEDKKQQMIIPG